jgi:hypothetical protein
MTPRTTLTTASGKLVDLAAPSGKDIDFNDIAEHLSKVNRYCGATRGYAYSVAEHSVRAADAALAETGDRELASYLLCHDMHEAYLGDDTTPKKRALEEIISRFGILAGEVERAFAEMTDSLDLAIHTAAGLKWPINQRLQARVKHYDRVMLFTEFRDLMSVPPYFEMDAGIKPLENRLAITPYVKSPSFGCWPWLYAMDMMLNRCTQLLPAMMREPVA